jgi:DNA-binding NtrC family response regulator
MDPRDTRSTIVEEDPTGPPADHGRVLLVMSPDHFNTVPLAKAAVLTIGRSTRADIRIEDPKASREHARLHIDDEIRVVDLNSQNGTSVRNAPIAPGEAITVVPGETISIGNTVLMVQRSASTVGRRWLWSHAYFESRVAAECSKEIASRTAHFALVRLRFERGVTWTQLAPTFARRVAPPHIFASYGPHDFEVLFVDLDASEATTLVSALCADLESANLTVRCGVAHFPQDGRSADALLARANALLRPNGAAEGPDIESPSMERIRGMAQRAAASNINILILGETGVGKEVLAQAIHRMSPRAQGPMVALNCAELNETLLESELFGYEKGAFTGAGQSKAGLLETADKGTVFLDEVGELPLGLQAKLLRFLETREMKRLGALKSRSIDVRFIAATNVVLEEAVAKGTFRRDLFFRLNVICLEIPPLRERVGEIPVLAQQFLERACRDLGRLVPTIDEEVFDLFRSYGWEGNIRELRNIIERAAVLCEGDWLLPEHLPLEKMEAIGPDPTPPEARAVRSTPTASAPVTSEDGAPDERQRMIEALAQNAGNQTRAAAMLGMPRRTFVFKLVRYGIPRPHRGAPSAKQDDDKT